MARRTTLVFKNYQQNGSFRNHQILKKKIPITSSFIVVSCPWFLLFCFVLYHQSWGLTYTQALKNIIVFGLINGGWLIHESTYTQKNMVHVHMYTTKIFCNQNRTSLWAGSWLLTYSWRNCSSSGHWLAGRSCLAITLTWIDDIMWTLSKLIVWH